MAKRLWLLYWWALGVESGVAGFFRESFDRLRDSVVPFFENKASEFLHDPWSARSSYIGVVLERSPESICRVDARAGFQAADRGRKSYGLETYGVAETFNAHVYKLRLVLR